MPSSAKTTEYVLRTEEGAEAKGPSKSELKKRAKEAEKAKKAAEKAARQAELEAQKAAAEVVRIPAFHLASIVDLTSPRTGLRDRILWQATAEQVTGTPAATPRADRVPHARHGRHASLPARPRPDVACAGEQDGLLQPPSAHRLHPGTSHSLTREGEQADGQMGRGPRDGEYRAS